MKDESQPGRALFSPQPSAFSLSLKPSAFSQDAQARIPRTTSPWTSVSRMSRPPKR